MSEMVTRIATHSGSFHADDVFGVAVLAALHPQHEIARTREPREVAAADFAVDVGGEWDPQRGRFDHHQRGFDGARLKADASGATVRGEGYASAGLVWREFGPSYVKQAAQAMGHTLAEGQLAQVAQEVIGISTRLDDFDERWEAEVVRICRMMPSLPDLDRTASVSILTGPPVTVVATLADGRTARREVTSPSLLRHTVEALVTTVPALPNMPVDTAAGADSRGDKGAKDTLSDLRGRQVVLFMMNVAAPRARVGPWR